MIKLHNIDCMKYMKTCEDNKFDLAIVDVNYGINQGGSTNKTRSKLAISKDYHSYDDSSSPDISYFKKLIRISKNQIIWGANHFISKIPFDSSCWIVWDKDNGTTDFADCELAYTSFKTAVRILKYRWQGMLQQNMKNKQKRIHPNEKPIKLYEWLLINYAKPGQTIFDSHFGSLSIGIACHNLGFDLTACELDKDYFDAAKKRLEIHQMQKRLW